MNKLHAEIADAVTPRAFAIVVGVLLLQLGFVLSYVGAFHSPKPQRIPVAVVAPASKAPALAANLNRLGGHPLSATVVGSEAAAARRIREGSLSGALVINTRGDTDRLLVASGGGSSVVTAVQEVFQKVEASQHRKVTSTDLVPLQAGDARGLSGFYLVIGWMVGGYLVASALGVTVGARPATLRRAAIRLGALVPYAVLSGLGGALIIGPVLGALNGHLLALWWLGALIVFASAAATTAFQVLLSTIGIGVAVLLFVVLGNPSAGGAFQPTLVPPFWRAIAYALPNGAGTDTVRRIVYFGSHGIGGHLLVLALWAVTGSAVALVGAHLFHRSHAQDETEPPADPEAPAVAELG